MKIDPEDLSPSGLSRRPSIYDAAMGRSNPKRHAPPQPCVYFVEAKGTPWVKIGTVLRFDTIQERINDLQIGCPHELRLAFIIDGGGRREEHLYHRALDHLRYRGEWFRREGVLAELLDAARADELKAHEIAFRLISG